MIDQTPEPAPGDIQAAITAGMETATPQALTPALFVVRDGNGSSTVIDVRDWEDKYRPRPRRKTGLITVTRPESFLDYLARHGDEDTEITVDTTQQLVYAFLDGHGPDEPGHKAHKVNLLFPKSDQWNLWTGRNGKAMGQRDFAEFVEENLVDIVDPNSATMLEIVSSLSATTKATFHSAHRLSDGSTEFEWTQETNAKAGNKAGRLDIPARFTIGIPVFRGAEPVPVTARFRYRISEGGLLMSFHLDRPGDVLSAAFETEIDAIRDGVGDLHPIYVN